VLERRAEEGSRVSAGGTDSLNRLTGGQETESYTAKPLTPITDPLELRDATVRDYVTAQNRAGLPVDSEQIRRMAQSHLELVEAYRRGVDHTANKAPPSPIKRRAPEAAGAPESDVKLLGQQKPAERGVKVRPGILHRRAHKRSEKWSHAVARLKRITEGFTPVFNAAGELDLKASMATAAIPHLAERYWRLYQNFRMWTRDSRHNPFRTAAGGTMSLADATRMFEAEVYAICDASTSKLKHWWIK
jgi:hypothetical protein